MKDCFGLHGHSAFGTASVASLPAAGRLPATAGHRAAVVIKGDVVSGVVVVRVFCQRVCHFPMHCCAIGSLIPYQMIKRQVSTLPIGVTTIGDLESNDDSQYCTSTGIKS